MIDSEVWTVLEMFSDTTLAGLALLSLYDCFSNFPLAFSGAVGRVCWNSQLAAGAEILVCFAHNNYTHVSKTTARRRRRKFGVFGSLFQLKKLSRWSENADTAENLGFVLKGIVHIYAVKNPSFRPKLSYGPENLREYASHRYFPISFKKFCLDPL